MWKLVVWLPTWKLSPSTTRPASVAARMSSTASPGGAPNFEESSTIAPVFGTLSRRQSPACGACCYADLPAALQSTRKAARITQTALAAAMRKRGHRWTAGIVSEKEAGKRGTWLHELDDWRTCIDTLSKETPCE